MDALERATKAAEEKFVENDDLVGKTIKSVMCDPNGIHSKDLVILFTDGTYTRAFVERDYGDDFVAFEGVKYRSDMVRVGLLTKEEDAEIDRQEERTRDQQYLARQFDEYKRLKAMFEKGGTQ